MTIKGFRGENYFLSNFYKCKVVYNGITYLNNEAAFQSMKTLSVEQRKEFADLDPLSAKHKGRNIRLRDDWEEVKDRVMYEICRNKFVQNKDLQIKLLNTDNKYLEECNTWNDREWGTCNGIGKNKLGKILMKIRDELNETIL